MEGPTESASKGAGDWSVQLGFEESEVRTKAFVTLKTGKRMLEAYGIARRNPVDPNLPRVGEDLAVARALSKLAHELLSDAAAQLEVATHAAAGIREA